MQPSHQYVLSREPFHGTSIIVPVYNALDYARDCIDRLYRVPTQVTFEVIVVDDGSAPEVRDWLNEESTRRDRFSFISFDQNRGFAAAVNAGAAIACGNTLCLLNSDTLVAAGWLDRLHAALENDSELGIVSPITNSLGSLAQLNQEAPENPLSIDRFTAQLKDNGQVINEPARLTFFCVLIRQTLWEKLSGLTEIYGSGNYEDDDFCLRTRLLGYLLGVVPSAFVFHYAKRSFDANEIDHASLLNQNAKRFARRAWDFSTELGNHVRRKPINSSITVIVPVVDLTSDLRRSLASLTNQTIGGFEVLIINGTQASLAPILDEYRDRLTLVAATSEPSLLAAVNVGLQMAQGNAIAYLPAGAVYYPFHLEVLWQNLREQAIVCTEFAWHPASADSSIEVSVQVLGSDTIWVKPAFPLVCWGHQRRCLETAPLWNLAAPFPEWEWLLRLARHYEIAYHRYVTCDAGLMDAREVPLDVLHRMYNSFPVWWEPNLLWIRTQMLENRNSVQDEISERQPSWQPIEIARQVYRWLIPYQSRLRIDRWIRKLLSAPFDLKLHIEEQLAALPEPVLQFPAQSDRFDVLLFAVNPWEHLFQRPQHFARLLGNKQHRVFYIDAEFHTAASPWWDGSPFKEVMPNVFQIHLPSSHADLYQYGMYGTASDTEAMATALAQIDRVYRFQQVVCLSHTPDWVNLLQLLQREHSWPVVYDCLDDWDAFGKTYNAQRPQSLENRLVNTCDLLVTTAQILYDRWQHRKSAIVLLPNAASYDLFSQALPSPDLDRIASPIIGMYGSLDSRLDFAMLLEVACAQPDWQFVFVGSTNFPTKDRVKAWWSLTRLPNVHVFSPMNQEKLATYLARFDICTIPFRDLPMTRAMNFVKLYEFLAAGKPVLAADLNEVKPFAERGLVRTYRDAQDFIALAKIALKEPPDSAKLQAFAAQHTWEDRVATLEAAMAKLIPESP
jgi:GT2 family glycosyltransferase/glycosyltransferase involved in cell wall biosynthesis